MCLLIETLRIEHCKIKNLELHNWRFNKSRQALFGSNNILDLEQFIQSKKLNSDVVYKCRITYNLNIKNIEFEPYHPKSINTIKLVESNTIDYAYKYKNRQVLNQLKNKASADEILIVKKGEITDFSFANVVFFTKDLCAFTPLNPLLKGTKRQLLINQKRVKPTIITPNDLVKYAYLKPINALLNYKTTPFIDVKNIFS